MRSRTLAGIAIVILFGASVLLFSDDEPQTKSNDTKPRIHVVPKNKPLLLEMPSPPPNNDGRREKPQPRPAMRDRLSQRRTSDGPPPLPTPAVPNASSREGPIHDSLPDTVSDLAGEVLTQKVGSKRVQQILLNVNDRPGQGSSNADTFFDGANIRNGRDVVIPGDSARAAETPPTVKEAAPVLESSFPPTTTQDSSAISMSYGSVPGGVVLEGQADLAPVEDVTYDSRFNALVINSRGVYFLKVSPQVVIELCRALAQKDEVGVSLGKVQISYGALPRKSRLATDLLLADHFLASIAFGWQDWTAGYKFANDYQPQQWTPTMNAAVFFRFNGFEFRLEQREYRLVHESFEDRFIPLSRQVASDGGSLPDEAAVEAGVVPAEVAANLQHIADHIEYYWREELIEQTFSYGETAAFLRGLKAAGVDLNDLADGIASQYSGD